MKKNMKGYLLVLAIIVAMTLMIAGTSFAAAGWQQKYERFAATAGETLTVGQAVCIKAADGLAWKADADDSSLRPAVGVVGKGGSATEIVEIVTRGILTGQTAASPGTRIFLSTTAGGKTASEPTNSQLLGWVMPAIAGGASSTVYYINVQQPGTASAGY